jgi:hypothetical protein
MPCHDSQNSSSEFPSFPSNFELDTPHIHQAIAEHNYKRVEQGLPTQNYFQLSDVDRHQILDRSNKIKFGSRLRVIPLKLSQVDPTKERAAYLLQHEGNHFKSIFRYGILAAGALILITSVLRYL